MQHYLNCSLTTNVVEYSLKYQESFSNESQPPTCQQVYGLEQGTGPGSLCGGSGVGGGFELHVVG